MVGTSGFELPENLLQSAADYLLLHYEPEEAEFLEAAKFSKPSRKSRADSDGSLSEPRGVEMSRSSCAPSAAPAGVPENEIYDIMEVNALLDHFGEPTLS